MKIAAAVVVALAATILFGAPVLVPSFARGPLQDALRSSLAGSSDLGDISFSWPANASVRDVVLSDVDGNAVFEAAEIEVRASLASLLRGGVDADVVVRGWKAHLRLDDAGRWSADKLIRSAESEREGGIDDGAPSGNRELDVRCVVEEGTLAVVPSDRAGVAHTVSARLDWNAAAGRLTAGLQVGDGASGALTADLAAATGTANDGETSSQQEGKLRLKIDSFDIGIATSGWAAKSDAARWKGVVNGVVDATLHADRSLNVVVETALAGAQPPGFPSALEDVAIAATVNGALDGVLLLTGSVGLPAGLEASASVSLQDLPSGSPTGSGTVRIGGDLRTVRSLCGKAGLDLTDAPTADGRFEGTLRLARAAAPATAAAAGEARFELNLREFVVRDAAGTVIPVDPELWLRGSATADPTGRLELKDAELVSGSLRATASAAFSAESRVPTSVRAGLKADLADLRNKLAPFGLAPPELSGSIDVAAEIDSPAGVSSASVRGTLRRARFRGRDGWAFGPGDGSIEAVGSFDSGALRAELRRGTLKLPGVELAADGRAEGWNEASRLDGKARVVVTVDPARVAAMLPADRRPQVSADSSVRVAVDVAAAKGAVDVVYDVKSPALRWSAAGGGGGGGGVRMRDLKASGKGRYEFGPGRFALQDALLTCAALGTVDGAPLEDVRVAAAVAGDADHLRLVKTTVTTRGVAFELDGSCAGMATAQPRFGGRAVLRVDAKQLADVCAGFGLADAEGRLLVDVAAPPATEAADRAATTTVTVEGRDLGGRLAASETEFRGLTTDLAASIRWRGDGGMRIDAADVRRARIAATRVRAAETNIDAACAFEAVGDYAADRWRLASFKADGPFGALSGSGTLRGDGSADGSASGEGDVGRLLAFARALTGEADGWSGSGRWRVSASAGRAGDLTKLGAELVLSGATLSGPPSSEPLIDAADVRAALDGAYSASGAGALRIASAELAAPGVRARVTGEILAPLGPQRSAALRGEGELRPSELQSAFGGRWPDFSFGGLPVSWSGDVTDQAGRSTGTVRLRAPEISVTALRPDESGTRRPPIRQRGLEVDVAGVFEADSGALEVSAARVASESGSVRASGRILRSGSGSDLKFDGEADLARTLTDLGGATTPAARGRIGFDARLQTGADMGGTCAGRVVATELEIDVADAATGTVRTVRDPSATFTFDLAGAPAGGGARWIVRKFAADSTLISGDASGAVVVAADRSLELRPFAGTFRYVPDAVVAALRPWCALRFAGTTPRTVTFNLEGGLKADGPVALLRALRIDTTAEVAAWSQGGWTFGDGPLTVACDLASAKVDGRFKANEGSCVLKIRAPLMPTPGGTAIDVQLDRARLSADLGPSMAFLSPLLSVNGAAAGQQMKGFVAGAIRIDYPAALSDPLLAAGWAAFPQRELTGFGEVSVTELETSGGSALGSVAAALLGGGATAQSSRASLDAIRFHLQDGRVYYDEPVRIGVGGIATRWWGSIGLDRTLDMTMETPMTSALGALGGVAGIPEGTVVRIPVRGTTDAPDLRIGEGLAKAAPGALVRKAGESLGGAAGGVLGGVLGGGRAEPKATGGTPTTEDDPEVDALLRLHKADGLFLRGAKPEAAALYRDIRDRLRRTAVYASASSRIEARGR